VILIQAVLHIVYHEKRRLVNIFLVYFFQKYFIQLTEFHTYHTKVFHAVFEKVDMRQLLPDLTENWPGDIVHQYVGKPFEIKAPVFDSNNKNEIIHKYFWHKLPDFIPENSIVVAETGTSAFGKFVNIILL
jgi:pyruvate decarboxylase